MNAFWDGFFARFCDRMLAWNAAVLLLALAFRFTGRFWQRNTSPRLRCAAYALILYVSLVWPHLFDFYGLLPASLPGALALYLRVPAAGQTPLPALRTTNWAALAGAVWLLGALICLIVRAVPRLRLRRFLKRRRRMAGPRVRRVARRLWRELNGLDDLGRDRTFEPRLSDEDICVVDGLPGQMCVTSSLARGPCLLLDREDYDDETLDAILRHELSHLTKKGLRLWGYEDVLAALGWWDPGAWLLRRHLRAENELCCDDQANRDRSRAGRAAYARALTALAARKRAFLPGTAQMACEKGLLRRRVQAVMEPPSPRRSFFAGALLFLLVFACLFFCQPPQRDTALLTEQNLFSYLAASGDDRPEAFNFGAAGAVYGARDVEGSRQGELSLTYAGEAALASGRARLETAITARLGAPQRQDAWATVWQTEDADGNMTAVTLSQLDEKALTLQ